MSTVYLTQSPGTVYNVWFTVVCCGVLGPLKRAFCDGTAELLTFLFPYRYSLCPRPNSRGPNLAWTSESRYEGISGAVCVKSIPISCTSVGPPGTTGSAQRLTNERATHLAISALCDGSENSMRIHGKRPLQRKQ